VTGLKQNPGEDICSLSLLPHQRNFIFACFCHNCQMPIDPTYSHTCNFASMMKNLQKLTGLQLHWATSSEAKI